VDAATLAQELRKIRFRYTTEAELQVGLAEALQRLGVAAEREVVLGPRDRVDFLTVDGIGIEVKVKGSCTELTCQLHRYAQHDRIRALIVVTHRAVHHGIPTELNGRQVYLVQLLHGLF
jgi:hypothetical protein